MSVKFSDFEKYSGNKGGNKYFSIKDKESATVRFLYNTYDDINGIICHNVKVGDRYSLVACPREEGQPLDTCKYCSMENPNRPVLRVVIPLFNEGTNQIEYWVKSGQYVDGLRMFFDEVIKLGKPIASQQYIIKRDGSGLDTKYAIIPTAVSDDKKAEDFGTIEKDPINGLHMIKPANWEPEESNNVAQQTSNVDITATRRTADIF